MKRTIFSRKGEIVFSTFFSTMALSIVWPNDVNGFQWVAMILFVRQCSLYFKKLLKGIEICFLLGNDRLLDRYIIKMLLFLIIISVLLILNQRYLLISVSAQEVVEWVLFAYFLFSILRWQRLHALHQKSL
jgi:hypothetical protein